MRTISTNKFDNFLKLAIRSLEKGYVTLDSWSFRMEVIRPLELLNFKISRIGDYYYVEDFDEPLIVFSYSDGKFRVCETFFEYHFHENSF